MAGGTMMGLMTAERLGPSPPLVAQIIIGVAGVAMAFFYGIAIWENWLKKRA